MQSPSNTHICISIVFHSKRTHLQSALTHTHTHTWKTPPTRKHLFTYNYIHTINTQKVPIETESKITKNQSPINWTTTHIHTQKKKKERNTEYNAKLLKTLSHTNTQWNTLPSPFSPALIPVHGRPPKKKKRYTNAAYSLSQWRLQKKQLSTRITTLNWFEQYACSHTIFIFDKM